MSITAEEEHRKVDDALPLPELVDRAGALRGMLEKGYHPHNSFNFTSEGDYHVDQIFPIKSTYQGGPRESNSGTGAMANFTGPFSRTRRGTCIQRSWQAAPDSPKIKHMPMTKKQKIIAVGCIAIVGLGLILGIGLGTGFAKKHKGAKCLQNFTGNACDLGG
jgi:hypothetical protein